MPQLKLQTTISPCRWLAQCIATCNTVQARYVCHMSARGHM
jgi:hypothetical protein